MERALQAVVATMFLTIAIAMIWHERSRLRAKQPLLRHNAHLLELYWMAYCSLLVLGMTFAISAAIRTSAAP